MTRMKKMKGATANFHQSNFADVEAATRSKQQRLLEDYLELQKEYVSKKKKLQIAKQKKETLLAEVRFLRHKHRSFRLRSEALEHEQVAKSKSVPTSRNYSVSESVLRSSSPALHCNRVMGNGEQDVRKKEEAVSKPLRVQKPPKYCLSNKKRAGKKKTSWQDQVALKV